MAECCVAFSSAHICSVHLCVRSVAEVNLVWLSKYILRISDYRGHCVHAYLLSYMFDVVGVWETPERLPAHSPNVALRKVDVCAE